MPCRADLRANDDGGATTQTGEKAFSSDFYDARNYGPLRSRNAESVVEFKRKHDTYPTGGDYTRSHEIRLVFRPSQSFIQLLLFVLEVVGLLLGD
jgi:hypothetical protein